MTQYEEDTEKFIADYHIAAGNKKCPNCAIPLVCKTNSKTKDNFLGCSNYPECDFATYIVEEEE